MMGLEVQTLIGGIAVGAAATLIMDLWNVFLQRMFNIASLNYCLLGRWLLHMPEGEFRHASMTSASPKPYECPVGWIAHYAIGIGLTVVFVWLASAEWLAHPTVLPALLYGIGTIVFPFFVLQPAFGLGLAASRSPNPLQARLKSLATHTIFGIGIYLAALGLGGIF